MSRRRLLTPIAFLAAVCLVAALALPRLMALTEEAAAAVVDEVEDGLNELDAWVYLDAPEIAEAFADPWSRQYHGVSHLTRVYAADLRLPTGRVVAGDVFLDDPTPLDRSFEPGSQPVTLLVATLDDHDERVAAALLGDSAAAVRWVPAFTSPEGAEGYGVYAVNSGTAAFASHESVAADGRAADRTTVVLDALRIAEQEGRSWATLDGARSGAGLIAFAAGYGDGSYPLWWGLDRENRPVALLTDFGVLVNGAPEQESVPMSLGPRRTA